MPLIRFRNTPPLRAVSRDASPFAWQERPRPVRKGTWTPTVIRLLTLAWAGAIMATLVETFGSVPNVMFITAMGLTGLLVAAGFLWTRPEPAVDDPREPGPDEYDATHDSLTELPTFNHFSRRLSDEFARARRMGRRLAVVLIDVNNLTAVNREYGVAAGDAVLRHVARAVDATKRYNDVVARLGDDEFGLVLLDTGEEGVTAFVERLEDRLARESVTAEVSGRTLSLWAGICTGSSVGSGAMSAADEVLDAAVASLDQAKQERERRRRMWRTA